MKNKKIVIGIIIAIVLIVAMIVGIIIINMPKEKPEEVLNTYFSYIKDQNYEAMYEKLSNHPIKKLYDMGLLVTINTDNRTVSNTNLTKSYQDLQEVFSFTKQDFLKMNENALQSAFLNQAEIEELLALLHK